MWSLISDKMTKTFINRLDSSIIRFKRGNNKMIKYIRNTLAGLALTGVVACNPVPEYVNETLKPLVREAEFVVEDYNKNPELFSKDKRITDINKRIDQVLIAFNCSPDCLDLVATQFDGVADDYKLKEIEGDNCRCSDYGSLVSALANMKPREGARLTRALSGKD